MRIAIVAGGWHWPLHFFEKIAFQAQGADLFVVAHRDPDLDIVHQEKRSILCAASGPLGDLDRKLYGCYATRETLKYMGWRYQDAPNTVGDWGFFNQWLETHSYRKYDVILSCHDDTYIRGLGLFEQLAGNWLILSNGTYPQAPEAYVRGSFEFFRREMLDLLGGRIDLGSVGLTREGKTDTPVGLAALSEWNNTAVPLRNFMASRGLSSRISYLSNFYRVSKWAIEGERGFLHYTDGVPWSFEEGLRATEVCKAA